MPRKTCKFRLSRNSTKFYVLARFRETIPTVKSISSSDIQRINFGFLTEITILLSKLRVCPFSRNWNFSGLTHFTVKSFFPFSFLFQTLRFFRKIGQSFLCFSDFPKFTKPAKTFKNTSNIPIFNFLVRTPCPQLNQYNIYTYT